MARVASSASLCIVSTMTLLSMRSAFRRVSTSMPLNPGIDRSVTITSGSQARGSVNQRLAVTHGADDVEIVFLEQADEPSLTIVWSSAISTVGRRM